MTLPTRFSRLLTATGHTVAGLAELAGMSRQQVHAITTGDVRNPGVKTVERIVESAGWTMAEFYRDDD